MDAGFDTTELRRFVADLRQVPQAARRDVRAMIEKGALNIARQLRQEMGRSRHFGQVSRAISYDIADRASSVDAEIGPVTGSPGSLANIAYFGTSRGGGTVPEPYGALKAEAPNLTRYLTEAMARWIP